MATKAMNLTLEESRINEVKTVAHVFHKTITDVVNEALDDYLKRAKQDPFYRLTANVEAASEDETNEILSQIDSLSDDDLKISTVKRFKA